MIAVGGIDNAITLIDMTTTSDGGENIMRLPTMGETHDGLVASLAFLDEQRIASAGGDGDVRLWDIEKGETSDVLSGHTRDCSKVAVHRPSAGYGNAPSPPPRSTAPSACGMRVRLPPPTSSSAAARPRWAPSASSRRAT